MPDTRPFANAAEALIVHSRVHEESQLLGFPRDEAGEAMSPRVREQDRRTQRVLLMRRRADDVHRPNEWDTPGGRLADGEDPFTGVQREVREEVGLDVDVGQVIDVHYFTRDDGQVITMMIFACTPKTFDVRLSDEHVEYRWVPLADAGALAPEWLPPIIVKYERWMRGA